jgi:hypothetical protein
MLREGLAAEFPLAKRAVGDLIVAARSLHVSREAPAWAAVSGFGAIWAVGAIGEPAATALRVAGLRDPASWLSGGVAILGYAVAIAVALRAGGRRGLLWFVAILGLRTLLQLGVALPGVLTLCERGGECSPVRLVLQYVFPYVYLAAGTVLSAVTILVLRAGREGPNVFLGGAGVFSLLGGVIGLAYFVAPPRDAVSFSAMDFAMSGTAAAISGAVLRRRSARLAPAVLICGLLVVTWIASSGPFIYSVVRDGAGSQPASVYARGLIEALAFALGWLAAHGGQRARTTAAA